MPPSDAETTLRHALDADPNDVGAASQLARVLAREGQAEEASALLRGAEQRICPDPLLKIRDKAAALATLRAARFELDYRYEEVRCREWLSWPPQGNTKGGLAHVWTLNSEAGWVWRAAHLCADRRQVFVHKMLASAYAKARLHGVDLQTGQVLWTLERDGVLGDMRFWGDDWLLLCWWTQHGLDLELVDRAKGKVASRLTLNEPCQHRTLVPVNGAAGGVVSGVIDRDARLGVVDVAAMAVRWEPLSSASTSQVLLASARRHHAMTGHAHGLIGRLGLPFELLALWRETHGDEHLVFGWLIQHLGREEAKLHGRLWRIRADHWEEIALPERWRHEPVVPRFYRVGRGWIGTLQGHRLRVEHGARGLGVTPLGPVTAAQPDVWRLADDATQAQALPLGHMGAHDSLLAGGLWWQVRPSPARLSAYLTPGKGLVKQLIAQSIPALSGAVAPDGWDRPEALAALHVVPLGPSVLQISPATLTCRQLG